MHTWPRWRTTGIALAALLAGVVAARANVIEVSASSTVWLAPGGRLEVDVSLANFAFNNPGAPPPIRLDLQLLAPAGQADLSVLPGSTGQYYSGFALEGEVTFGDGLTATPFLDAAAARAGLDGASLLLRDGSLATGAGARPIGIVNGAAAVAFGPTSQNIVRILLTNLGPALALGGGDGYTLRTSLLLGVSGGYGSVETAGLVQSAWIDGSTPLSVPEQNSGLLALAPLLAAALLVFGYHFLTRAWINPSSKNGCTTTSSR